MTFLPSDVDVAGVYWPPLLLSFLFGLVAMILTVYLLNRYRLSRYFNYPMVVMAAITTIYTVILGTFVFPT